MQFVAFRTFYPFKSHLDLAHSHPLNLTCRRLAVLVLYEFRLNSRGEAECQIFLDRGFDCEIECQAFVASGIRDKRFAESPSRGNKLTALAFKLKRTPRQNSKKAWGRTPSANRTTCFTRAFKRSMALTCGPVSEEFLPSLNLPAAPVSGGCLTSGSSNRDPMTSSLKLLLGITRTRAKYF